MILVSVPVQEEPFPVNPSLQAQLYEPLVLVQVALLSQLCTNVPLVHSSISK